MMYPLVRELAVDGTPRRGDVPGPQDRWPALRPVAQMPPTDAELDEPYLANAIFGAHRDDPEFGYRFLAGEVRLR